MPADGDVAIKGYRCHECGLDEAGDPPVSKRTGCVVCPDCGSDDIDAGEFTLEDEP